MVGNYLNQGAKPAVSGFNLDFLVKLQMIKGVGNNSKATMLEYLVTLIREREELGFAVLLERTE